MSGTESLGGDISPTCQRRVSRIHSVGLPARTSLLPEPPPSASGSNAPPPIPRRHSATPAVAPPPIPLRPPAIPKRSKNEKPIPVKTAARQESQTNRRKTSDPTAPSSSVLAASWNSETSSEKLIDLGPFRTQEHRPSQDYSLAFQESDVQSSSESNDFVADFESVTFEDGSKIAEKSSFEDLQTVSRDLEKTIHERIGKNTEPKFKNSQTTRASKQTTSRAQQSKLAKEPSDSEDSEDSVTTEGSAREKLAVSRRDVFPAEDDRKFTVVLRPRRENERRSKFEELQAASKNLERRLHETIEEDEHYRLGRDRANSRYEEFQRSSEDIERRFHPEQKSLEQQSGARGKYEVDMERARSILNNLRRERGTEKLEKLPKATQTNLPPPLSAIVQSPVPKPISVRQDSNVSSDSFSQTSSPSYTNKTMEAPLLPHKHGRVPDRALVSEPDSSSGRPITKSTSTPASLQTIVRMHGGNNSSLHHKIIRTSSHYVTTGRIRFRYVQVLVNAVALLAIAGGLAAYFKSYPETIIRLENRMIPSTERIPIALEERNPAPGVCLPIIVTFCQAHKIPYNFTVFPNYMGNFRQYDAQYELEPYGPVVNVGCYELAALFLCSVFAPKCGTKGHFVRPCRSLCFQFKRRCGFFLGVFGLTLPEHLECHLFPENANPDDCVGHYEVIEAARRAEKPVCTSGFQCDLTRCIPVDWRCDGHLDCADSADEIGCGECNSTLPASTSAFNNKIMKVPVLAKNSVASLHCGERRCMFASHVCDGAMDCPWGQDERFCLKLSERNGDVGEGRLEVYHAEMGKFMPACIAHWDSNSTQTICSLLGYTAGRSSPRFISDNANFTQLNTVGRRINLLKEFQECITDLEDYPTVDLTCSEYACGRRRRVYGHLRVKTRIVGGVESAPGDWPFLAALLGGPEQIFYCAGVLIADQWVLTASHCVGNVSHTEVNGFTIQLGITRRHTHTYLGQKLKVKKVVPHPAYIFGVHDNDIALFQLEKRVQYHEHLRPVCLPAANSHLKPGTLCTVIGWGKKNDTDYFGYEPAVNEVQVPVLNRKICNSWLAHKELNVTDGMICAGYPDGGKDACQGDSGGPLLCQDENDKERWFVGGIVSWGIKCAHPKLPGVYAYVPKYVPWIRDVMAAETARG